MRRELKVKTPSLQAATELTVSAPIRPGFVPSLDSVTYKTRVRQLLKTLQAGRKSSHEYQLFRGLSDAVERVGVIHSLRVAVLEPEDKVFLSVNFDGAYESYVRVIWQKASRLLDLIFCNTVDYVTGWDHSFDEWSRWLRSVQVEIPLFYAVPGVTYPDQQYLRMAERFSRRDASSELAVTQIVVPSAERIAWDTIQNQSDPASGPYVEPPSEPVVGSREAVRQGLQGLVGLYRLADLYPPGTPDGTLLHRAAHELLPEFARMQQMGQYKPAIRKASRRFREQVAWLEREEPLPAVRVPPELPQALPPYPADKVQGGILRTYDDVTHGAVCLLAFDEPAAVAALLAVFSPTTDDASPVPGSLLTNIAFTLEGLRACGLPEAQLEWFPPEFRQGMELRAGVLGDVRGNHPRRWKLPLRNWPEAVRDPDWVAPANAEPVRIPLGAVHAIVQVRLVDIQGQAPAVDPRLQIAKFLLDLLDGTAGVKPLSIQWLERMRVDGKVVDHFGFTDGQSQPLFAPQPGVPSFPNQVQLGEALVGYDNAADNWKDLFVNQTSERRTLMQDGSYLVVRKLRQNVDALDRAVDAVVGAEPAGAPDALTREHVLAKMMGRWPARHPDGGKPLVPLSTTDVNDFNYGDDAAGALCPLGAHIRRANPREIAASPPLKPSELESLPGARPPRLLRRGLPYGKPAAAERGLMFMAYNASIGEQFEVVQRWLSGGNSSGGYSGPGDPFIGVPESGRKRYFRFEHEGRTIRMPIDGTDGLGDDPRPIVQLEWGAYFFTPSTTALAYLRHVAEQACARVEVPWSVAEGEREIARLRRVERDAGAEAGAGAWKATLEDAEAIGSYLSASVWAAIRERHGGVLRVPYGVLVADRALVDQVLVDRRRRYSVGGYQQRLKQTIGAIYLGLDDDAGGEYAKQSAACNAAIQALSFEDGFAGARQAANLALDGFVTEAVERAQEYLEPRWELNLDVRELVDQVLARLCESWFGLSTDGDCFEPGGFRWTWKEGDPVLYPGHFTAPSRYTFQPAPGEMVEDMAVRHGNALTAAMRRLLQLKGTASITGPIARAVLDDPQGEPSVDLAARTIVGALMGFLPTTDGNLRRIVNEWMGDNTFWDLRSRIEPGSLADAASATKVLKTPMMRAMQLRPVPELIWRTAVRSHRLGRAASKSVRVGQGEIVILALASATQQGLQQGEAADVSPVFGGRRAPQGPTHACPGYAAAMGVMVGFLSAILDRAEALRPGPAPGILAFEGEVELPAPPAILLEDLHLLTIVPVPGAAHLGELLGWGDSWLRNEYVWWPLPWDLGDALATLGYGTDTFRDWSYGGNSLRLMAAQSVDSKSFYKKVLDSVSAHKTQGSALPKAILLGGGGNDVHQEDAAGVVPLCAMLNPKAGGPPELNEPEVKAFIDVRLAGWLKTVLDRLVGVTEGLIPIFVHGYDHPIPNGRGYVGFGPWLSPCVVDEMGYSIQPEGQAIMKTLIDRLNAMIDTVVSGYPADKQVHHLKLTGTLEAQPGFSQDYTVYWFNELHPTERGFRALADVVHAELAKLP